MATVRFEMRLEEELKAKVERACALTNCPNLKAYIAEVIEEHANKVIAEHDSFTLKNDVFDSFMVACENASAPNAALIKAAENAKKLGFK